MTVPFPEAMFFDVDGVLIDSLHVKGEAFALSFADFPNERDFIVNFHLANGGVNRVEKISHIFRQLTGHPPTDEELAARVEVFSRTVVEQVITAPEIAGARDAVATWSARAPLHAVSATPTSELQTILERRGLSCFFASIHGWPPSKTELLPTLVQGFGYQTSRCVMVGDSSEDEAAADAAGTQFIQVSGGPPGAESSRHPVIKDLNGLAEAVCHLADEACQ